MTHHLEWVCSHTSLLPYPPLILRRAVLAESRRSVIARGHGMGGG